MAQVKNCRICNGDDLYFFLNLGKMPPANSFVKMENAGKPEEAYPLEVCLCMGCGLVQLGYVVPPEKLFKDYVYYSSTSETLSRHFEKLASEILEGFTKKNDLIVEIGSNDGVLLKHMLGRGVRPLGIEPATKIAKFANQAGIETLNDFFNSETAKKILASHGFASVMIANNVFAHIPKLRDVVEGMRTLLAPDGVVIIESPYLCDFYEKFEFDTVYHEHLCYYSLKPLIRLFSDFGMEVFDAKKVDSHGGSLRIYVQKLGGGHMVNSAALSSFLAAEEGLGLYGKEAWGTFGKKVEMLRGELVSLLKKLKSDGKKIAIYSVPAKGNTLINYCGIGKSLVEFAVDKSPHKQNMLTPGMQIPVFGPEKIESERPDYLLILAWNYLDEITRQHEAFRKRGGRFIVPVPKPRIV